MFQNLLRRNILLGRYFLRYNSIYTESEIENAKKWLDSFDHSQIPQHVFKITFSRSSGPGGQKVNKTSSKAQISLDSGEWLSPNTSYWIPKPIQHQLKEKNLRYVTPKNGLLIQCDTERNREVNLENCFKRLMNEIKLNVYFAGEVSEEDKEKWQQLEIDHNERKKHNKKKHSEKKKLRSKNFDW
ncbi:unnamed protein product [Candida verbasci]|uniref:Prokaryotic-type class I peptide chain release factors domain-containing protein n=1 Tax=Candida verbasci TaxID=1227364 RepID=A0A9W4TUZ7_9ASCO|nr:unnamed protein product [Candida verbasci]